MAVAYLMMDSRTTDVGTIEKTAIELYHIVGLTSPDPQEATSFGNAQGLPLPNSLHPDLVNMPGVLVRSRRLMRIWAKPDGVTWDALVLVTYSNRLQFGSSSGLIRGGVIDGGAIRIKVPIWKFYQPGENAAANYMLSYSEDTRRTARMRFLRSATGIDPAEKIQIINLAGGMYYFPESSEEFSPGAHIPFILSTPRIYKNQFNQDIIEYEFTTELAVGGVPQGPNVDIPVPPLRPLEDWIPQATSSSGVIIPVSPVPVRTAVEKNGGNAPQPREVIPYMNGDL